MVLSNGGQYEMIQTLKDGVTATYENILVVSGTPSALLGVYSCSILNEIGTATRNITINGECSAYLSWLATSISSIFYEHLAQQSFIPFFNLSPIPLCILL